MLFERMFGYMEGYHAANDVINARASARLDELERLPVGVGLLTGLSALRSVPLGLHAAVRASVLWRKMISHCQAQQMITVADAATSSDLLGFAMGHAANEIVGEELATLSHLSSGMGVGQVRFVEQVGQDLPLSWEALDRGDLTLTHLQYLGRAVHSCSPRVTQAVDTQLIPLAVARGWTPGKLASEARKAVITLDPDGAAERAKKAKAAADVILLPGQDECATLIADGDAAMLVRVKAAIDTLAARLVRESPLPLPIGVARVQAMAELILGERTGTAPKLEGYLSIDLTTWLGLTQNPGQITAYGPISPATARLLAADTTFRLMLTDPTTGKALGLGTTRYRPTAELARFIKARDTTCEFPGCHQPSYRCDLDHCKEHRSHGPTDPDNLHPLCRRHHNLKTHKIWHVQINRDGTKTWTSPLGFTHTPDQNAYQLKPLQPLEPPNENQPPEDIDNRLPDQPNPNPPGDIDDPLPESPTITLEEYLHYSDELERQIFWNANRYYDQRPDLQIAG
jgi:Domain of unknown function (DUF222)